MRTSEAGISLIKRFEGCRLTKYLDAIGKPTIGYGHLLSSDSELEQITQEQAEEILKDDLKRFEVGIVKLITSPLNQNQFDALISFSFNLGLGTLQRSTLRMKLNRGEYEGAAGEFLKYIRAGGRVMNGLVARRHAEGMLFLA